MKKTSLLTVLLLVAYTIANAQGYTTLGIGISSPYGTLHVHNSEVTHGGVVPLSGDEPRLEGDNSETIFHITNGITGTTLTDGFVIDNNNYHVTLRNYEDGNLIIKNHDADLILSSSGKIGIGTVSSSYNFNVDGSMRVTSGMSLTGNMTMTGNMQVTGGMQISGGININNTTTHLTSDGKAYFADEVWIGSGFHCSAAGALKAKSLRVTLTDWSDYVFDPAYRLMPLDKVERYVHENHHLPDIPSAAEVEEQGVDVGEMNRLLLQKVEELTLYVIDLQKQLDELKMNR